MPREGQAKVPSPEEFKRLVKIARHSKYPARNVALIYTSFGLGLRVKEIASLTIQAICLPDGRLTDEILLKKHMTKGEHHRIVYLNHPKVRQALVDYLTERGHQPPAPLLHPNLPLFVSCRGLRFSPNSLQQVFSRLYADAGLAGASSHSGRRTFCTRLIESGADIKAVSKLMGHSSIAMTARYVEDNPLRLKRIAESIEL